MTTLGQAEAKVKEIIISVNDFYDKNTHTSWRESLDEWPSTPSGQQLIQSLVSEGAGRFVKADNPPPKGTYNLCVKESTGGERSNEIGNYSERGIWFCNTPLGREEMKHVDYWLDESPASHAAQGWVNVKDGLPGIGQEYNVFYDLEDGEPLVVSTMQFDFITKKWFDERAAGEECKTVTHWMPLPEPPSKSNSVQPPGWVAHFTDEQSFIDFLKWQKGEGK